MTGMQPFMTRGHIIESDVSSTTSTPLSDASHEPNLSSLPPTSLPSAVTLVSAIDTEKTPQLSTLRLLFAHIGYVFSFGTMLTV